MSLSGAEALLHHLCRIRKSRFRSKAGPRCPTGTRCPGAQVLRCPDHMAQDLKGGARLSSEPDAFARFFRQKRMQRFRNDVLIKYKIEWPKNDLKDQQGSFTHFSNSILSTYLQLFAESTIWRIIPRIVGLPGNPVVIGFVHSWFIPIIDGL